MQTKRSMYEIRNVLQQEITAALNEPYTEIEISEMTANDNYEVKGKFKVTPFLSQAVKRKGKFETTLDGNLKIVTLKITEEQQQ
jgi:hypothetical protein